MSSQPGKQTIALQILPNISRSKDNQTMKFDQLIKYNIRNIFLEKSYTKCGGETIPTPCFKKSKLSISLTWFIFTVFQVEIKSKYIEIKLQVPCFYLI